MPIISGVLQGNPLLGPSGKMASGNKLDSDEGGKNIIPGNTRTISKIL